MLASYLIVFIFALILIYAVMKEREELGCYRLSIARQCIDEDSVYVKNTKAEEGDTCKDLYQRIVSILSYQEKGGVWKRCLIIATIITFFVYIVYNINTKFNNINYYIVLLLVIFTLIYFYHNYINYHHFRKLKENGIEILQLMQQKCK
jgi:Flp pilus assembly protein TadB